MPNFKDILKLLFKEARDLLGIESNQTQPIFNRDIADFHGSILNLGGTQGELGRYKDRYASFLVGEKPVEDQIYTVNIDQNSRADLIADMGSATALKELPDKKFDIVYISVVPLNHINLQNTFTTVARVLKDDGIFLCAGNADEYKEEGTASNNPVTKVGKNHYVVDIPKILALTGFKQGKPIKEIDFENGKTIILPPSGAYMIASKSLQPINLNDLYQIFPILKIIVHDLFRGIAVDFEKNMQEEDSSPTMKQK